MKEYKTVFDVQAEVGLTKHLGSRSATEELVKFCHILPGYKVLDVGSGSGRTPIYLAKCYELNMVGVDIHPGMVAYASDQVEKHHLNGQVVFQEADAIDLPFEDNTFDAVIVESVTVFTSDVQQAVNEYARVVKRGGFVGMNESTFLQPDPPPEVVNWVSQEVARGAQVHTPEEWKAFLEMPRLRDVFAKIYPLDVKKQATETVRRYGVGGVTSAMLRSFKMHLLYPEIRAMFKEGTSTYPENLSEYFGYGLYIGRKPDGPTNNQRTSK
jgi:ubiquinone/menaquinone biosynthesis C-methylase UbiE